MHLDPRQRLSIAFINIEIHIFIQIQIQIQIQKIAKLQAFTDLQDGVEVVGAVAAKYNSNSGKNS